MMIHTLLTLCLVGYSAACVQWTIRYPPIIFGKTAELSCLIETNKTKETRVWQGGKDYKVLTTNRGTSDPKKYEEKSIIHGFKLESILKIFKFDEDDVNYDYSCSIGQDAEKRQKLELKPGDFELHPTKATSSVLTVLRNNHLDVVIELRKVYPEPKCKIMFNEVEITKRVSTKRSLNGIFYTMKETLEHRFSREICSGQMTITCLVGSSDVRIHEKKFDDCMPSPIKIYKDEYKDSFIVSVILGSILIAFAVIGLIAIAKYGKLRKVLCCLVNFRGENTFIQPNAAEVLAELRNQTDNMNQEFEC